MAVKKEKCWYVEFSWDNTVVKPNNAGFLAIGQTTFNPRYDTYGEVTTSEKYDGVEFSDTTGTYLGEPTSFTVRVIVKRKADVALAKKKAFEQYQEWAKIRLAEASKGMEETKNAMLELEKEIMISAE